jgi:hypothetical protein
VIAHKPEGNARLFAVSFHFCRFPVAGILRRKPPNILLKLVQNCSFSEEPASVQAQLQMFFLTTDPGLDDTDVRTAGAELHRPAARAQFGELVSTCRGGRMTHHCYGSDR